MLNANISLSPKLELEQSIPQLEVLDLKPADIMQQLVVKHNVGRQGKKLTLRKIFKDGSKIKVCEYNDYPVSRFIYKDNDRFTVTNIPLGYVGIECHKDDCDQATMCDELKCHGKFLCMVKFRAHKSLCIFILRNDQKDLRKIFAFPLVEFSTEEQELILLSAEDTVIKKFRGMKKTLGKDLGSKFKFIPQGKNNSQFWSIKENEKKFIIKAVVKAAINSSKVSDEQKAVCLIAY